MLDLFATRPGPLPADLSTFLSPRQVAYDRGCMHVCRPVPRRFVVLFSLALFSLCSFQDAHDPSVVVG